MTEFRIHLLLALRSNLISVINQRFINFGIPFLGEWPVKTLFILVKVILISNGFQPDYTVNFVNALSRQVDKLVLIGSDIYHQKDFSPDIEYVNLRGNQDENVTFLKKLFRITSYYWKLVFYVLFSKIERVHFMWFRFTLLEGVLITGLFRMVGKKCIYTVHDVIPHDRDTWINRRIFNMVYKVQNGLVVHTEYIKSRLSQEFHVHSRKIEFIRHGVYENIPNLIPGQTFARNKLDIESGRFVLLFYGAIAKYKGLDLLFTVFHDLESLLHDEITLLIAGKIRADYKKPFFKMKEGLDSENIHYYLGFQDEEMTELLFKSTNVVVLPYSEASQSGVLFLSYAYGVPVIAPSLGGFPQDISTSTGLLYEPGNPESLKKAIIEALDLNRSGQLPQEQDIKDFALLHYSWEKSCKKLFAFYSAL